MEQVPLVDSIERFHPLYTPPPVGAAEFALLWMHVSARKRFEGFSTEELRLRWMVEQGVKKA
jgi:hypothetical protein